MTDLVKGIDALLITNPTNIRYLTGFVGLSPEERESYVLLTRDTLCLFTSSLHIESTKNLKSYPPSGGSMAKQNKIKIIELSRESSIEKAIGEILSTFLPSKAEIPKRAWTAGHTQSGKIRLGFEDNDVKIAEYERLKSVLKDVQLIATTDRIETLRTIKRSDEIVNIRQACKIADDCFAFIIRQVKPGVTESEIAWKMESFIRQKGAQLAFSPIVAFGAHSSQPHYYSINTLSRGAKNNQGLALKSNDIILLDFGARVNGYCSDITRVVFVGKPKQEWTRAYETVFKAQKAVIQYLNHTISSGVYVTPASPAGRHTGGGLAGHRRKDSFPIVSGGRADKIAREIIEKAGFPTYPHSLGHNIGLSVHEGPRLSIYDDRELAEGMVFSVEPGIYVPGQYGVRIEDLIYIEKDGIKILTTSSKEIIML